jgi:hypothetical protein
MASLLVATISVGEAEVLVQQRSPSARRNTNAVRAYAQAMRDDNWVVNGMPIIISVENMLLDGYQRLLACIEAQTPFTTVILHRGAGQVGDQPAALPVTCMRETISPEQARKYLAHKARLSPARIAALVENLAQGRGLFDAQPLCFAQSGRLLKGRHRLSAVILAGGATDVAVIRGLEEAASQTYGLNAKRRTVVDGGAGSSGDQALVSAMANLLWYHEHKTLAVHKAKASTAEITQIVAAHPRLLVLRSFARRMALYGRASVLGYAAYVMERDDAALAASFLAVLEDGAAQHPGHPLRALCATLQAQRRRKAPQAKQLATLLAGWEQFKARQIRRASG